MFNSYKPDTEKLLVKCFEFDFPLTRLEKLFKDAETVAQCKVVLQRNYKVIRDAYKHFSGELQTGKLPCIGATQFNNLMCECPNGLVDSKTVKSSDVDLEFVASNSQRYDYPHFTDRHLIRFKFLEALVRLAVARYFKSSIKSTIPEAIETAFELHFNPYFG